MPSLAASDRLPKQASPEDQVAVIRAQKGDPEKFRNVLETLVADSKPANVFETVQITRDIEAAAAAIRADALFALYLQVFPPGFEQLDLDDKASFVSSFQEFVSRSGSSSWHAPLIKRVKSEIPFELPWTSEIYPGIEAELCLREINIVSRTDRDAPNEKSTALQLHVRRTKK